MEYNKIPCITAVGVKIEKEIRLKNCTDGRIKKEYLLSKPLTREFAAFFQDYGETRVINGLKKPFFTFLIPGCLNIKGFFTEPEIEVWYVPEFLCSGEEFLALLVAAYGMPSAGPHLASVHRQLLAQVSGDRQ
ncbi:MAG: hypothetical protein GYA23_03165 [Methanomicrobiales archaeon]|nr:hypothetical protein [Methanomicrobiales archaeon]